MRSFPRAGVAACLAMMMAWAGCGDTFRPVVNPITSPGGDPQNARMALVVSQSPSPGAGAVTQIDVSGDTNVGNHYVGTTPVHAVLVSNLAQAYIANRDSDNLSVYFPVAGGSVTTVSLPTGAAPVFSAVAGSSVYVAESGLGKVGVVSATTQALTTEVAVGSNPVGLAALPNGSKVYVVNQGSDSVSVISTADNTVLSTIGGFFSPVYAVANSAGTRVFVLNEGNDSVAVIDTTADALVTSANPPVPLPLPTGAVSSVPVPSPFSPFSFFMTYDSHLKRLYVVNPGTNNISIFDDSQSPPVEMAHSPVTVGTRPVAVAPLGDGSKVYVINAGETTGCAGEPTHGKVSVIIPSSNTVTGCVTVGNAPAWIAASADSTKVYVPHQGTSPGTTIIKTASDTVVTDLGAPFTDPNCTSGCTSLTPAFVITNPQ